MFEFEAKLEAASQAYKLGTVEFPKTRYRILESNTVENMLEGNPTKGMRI